MVRMHGGDLFHVDAVVYSRSCADRKGVLPGTFILWGRFLFQCERSRTWGERGGMNCLLEAMATVWMAARRQVVTEPVEEEVVSAHESLEQCRRNMEGRERELQWHIERLGTEALAKKKEGDIPQARARLQERRRCLKRLERLRHGLELVDNQIDAIKTSELDKEIMLTIKASTSAMRKAGITLGVQEVENVMSELDEQMREVQDITDVLANPAVMLSGTEEADLDAELDLLEAVGDGMIPQPLADPHPAPQPVQSMSVPPGVPASLPA